MVTVASECGAKWWREARLKKEKKIPIILKIV